MTETTFDICENKHKGNPLSKRANLLTKKNQDRARIKEYLKTVLDATCEETEIALGLHRSTCSARFSELKGSDEIVATTKRRTRTGCMAQAWTVKE